jgi:thymidylate kinase
MFIIFEGIDLSGKTTLANRMSELTGLEVVHPGGRIKDFVDFFNRLNSLPEKDVIFDRHPVISDLVYSCLEEREPKIDLAIKYTSVLFLKYFKPLIIFCNPGLKKLKEQLKYLKEKPHKSKEYVNKIIAHYDTLYDFYQVTMTELGNYNNIITVDPLIMKYTDDFLLKVYENGCKKNC